MTRIFNRSFQGVLFFSLMAGTPLLAWKTKLLGSNSVHGRISDGGLDYLRVRVNGGDSNRNAEWSRFGMILYSTTGWLNNDSNAHGNLIWNEERRNPEGMEGPSAGTPFWNPINFNGGPFYRWWFRALQAEALCTAVASPRESGSGSTRFKEWSRTLPTIQSTAVYASRIYQYLGLMAHLIQDNCAPAHMANIRHGWWEGVEWWHDASGSQLGGYGRDTPKPPGELPLILETSADGPNWGLISTHLKSYFFGNNSVKALFDPGKRTDDRTKPYSNLRSLLKDVIDTNKAHLMPGLSFPETHPYFDLTQGNQARALTNGEMDSIRNWEQNSVINFEVYFPRGMGVHELYPRGSTDPSNLDKKAPQMTFSGGEGLLVQGRWKKDQTQALSQAWHTDNDGRSLWIPNPKYSGEGWDTNFGSHGGFLGFPNRDFPLDTVGDIQLDFSSKGKGRILPGDLYVVHPEQNYTRLAQDPYGETGPYRDERSFEKVALNPILANSPDLADLGGQLVDRAALWSAVFYETASKYLPPMMASFHLRPRNTDPDYSKTPLPWFSANYGATIQLGFDSNRYEDCMVEFYALPLNQFRNLGNWKRTITINQSDEGLLFDSDLSVFDHFPGSTGTGNPPPGQTSSGTDTRRGIRPAYDFCYQQIVGYPVRVVWGEWDLRSFNLETSTVENQSPNHMLGIPSSQFETPVITPVLPSDVRSNRFPHQFNKKFTWNGEVGDPVYLFPDQAEPGGTTPNSYSTKDRNGKKVLPSGQYFIMAMVYKNGRRMAFSSNQYKLQNTAKFALEANDWINKAWTDIFMEECLYNRAHDLNFPEGILPDELFPIRIDNAQPKVRTE